MDIKEVIKARHSVRTFVEDALTPAEISRLSEELEGLKAPFGGAFNIVLQAFETQGESRPGTYGTIRGASHYFLIAARNDVASLLSAGFCMECMVLKAVSMGLGTCWISGTLRHSDFDVVNWPEGMSLIAIVAVGHPAESSRIREKITKFALGSNKRRDFGSMFFERDFTRPLRPGNAFAEGLAMMRLAPSSKNSQPWRALVCGGKVHFYCKKGRDINILDCGIGLAHFAVTMESVGRGGHFEVCSSVPDCPGFTYLVTFE